MDSGLSQKSTSKVKVLNPPLTLAEPLALGECQDLFPYESWKKYVFISFVYIINLSNLWKLLNKWQPFREIHPDVRLGDPPPEYGGVSGAHTSPINDAGLTQETITWASSSSWPGHSPVSATCQTDSVWAVCPALSCPRVCCSSENHHPHHCYIILLLF